MSEASERLGWRWILLIAALGTALHWQAVRIGYAGDDYVHLAMLQGIYPGERNALEMFTFFGKDPSELAGHLAFGTAPWWTVDEFFGAVMRPLASLLIQLDHTLFPLSPGPQHVHSLLWWAAAIVSAGLLFRRLLPPAVAAVALTLFALDDSVTIPVAWLANRAVLVSTVFCCIALWAHLRWREDNWRPAPFVEVGAWVLAFSAGEYAISGAAFVLAYEGIVGRREGLATAARGLAPAAGVLLGYMLLHRILGYGTVGSAVYVDPFAEPLAYLSWASARIPRLWSELFWGLPSNVGELALRVGFGWAWWLEEFPSVAALMRAATVLGVAASLLSAIPILITRTALPEQARNALGWPLLGAVLGLIPIASAPAHGRLLVVCNLGASIVLGWILVTAVRAFRERLGNLPRALALPAILLIPVHALIEPLAVYAEHAAFRIAHAQIVASLRTPELEAIDLENKRVILVAATEPTTGIHGHLVLHAMGRPLARSWHVLSMSLHPHALTRTAENTLELSSINGSMLQEPPERFFRPEEQPLAVGDIRDAGEIRATVMSVRGDGPDRVRFEFEGDLDSSDYVLLIINERGLTSIDMPAVGASIPIKPPRVPGMPAPLLRGR